jgi:hypothetical protein
MPEADWAQALLRGAAGLAAFVALFATARRRFAVREPTRGPADNGMD